MSRPWRSTCASACRGRWHRCVSVARLSARSGAISMMPPRTAFTRPAASAVSGELRKSMVWPHRRCYHRSIARGRAARRRLIDAMALSHQIRSRRGIGAAGGSAGRPRDRRGRRTQQFSAICEPEAPDRSPAPRRCSWSGFKYRLACTLKDIDVIAQCGRTTGHW